MKHISLYSLLLHAIVLFFVAIIVSKISSRFPAKQSDVSFYQKFSCQRVDARFLDAVSSGNFESYLREVLFNKANSKSQINILITDIFEDSGSCDFRHYHEEILYSLDPLFKALTEHYQSSLNLSSILILLQWVEKRCPEAHTGHPTSSFIGAQFIDLNGNIRPLPPQLEKVLHFSEEEFARKGSLALFSNKKTPDWAVERAFNDFLKKFDPYVEKDKASLDATHIDFLRIYLLSPERTREDILSFAYKPHRWLTPALRESSHFREEDLVISALLFSGE